MSRLAFALVAALAVGGCASSAPPPASDVPNAPIASSVRDALVGRWDMEQVLDGGTDVTAQADPEGNRTITLRADGSFVASGRPADRNQGRWVYRANTRRLGLDSDLGPENDSIWEVRLRGDRMVWTGVGSAYARRFRVTSRRVR